MIIFKRLKKMICIALAGLIFLMVGCALNKPVIDNGKKEDQYEYGNSWKDPYDKSYNDSLLEMDDSDFTRSQLVGSDALGRKVEVSSKKIGGKYVGIFYFLWLGEGWGDVYDISKILESNPGMETNIIENPLWANAGSNFYNPSISPQNAFHYFEEPLYGYYNSDDKWVIRKHLELLSNASIDFLYLDFTNAGIELDSQGNVKNVWNIYQKQMFALMDTILELQNLGYKVPQIVPICCNDTTSGGAKTITKVIEWCYENYYAKDNYKYKNCWFTADKVRNPSGNPLIVAYDFDAKYLKNKEIANSIWLRNVIWPTHVSSFENGFPWMDYSLPQDNYDGIMNVSIAQHTGGAWSSEAFLSRSRNDTSYKYRGRSASFSQKYAYETDNQEEAMNGKNFNDQWHNVLNYKGDEEVWMVTVTGWNEWVAQKLNILGGYSTFVDTFNIAFSRDIEMMRDENGYHDNFYMQLVANVKKFKYSTSGKNSNSAMWQRKTVDHNNLESWKSIESKYIDFVSDAQIRDTFSVGNKYKYTDNSSRNDIDYIKIANDSNYLYVLAKTTKDITPYQKDDNCWMNLYISTGIKDGWENYNYLVNRNPVGNKTSIEKLGIDNKNQIKTNVLEEYADINIFGEFIGYRIPLSALNIHSDSEIQIKVCDNIFANQKTIENDGVGVYQFGNKMAFYCGGDSAPMGLLNYAYRLGY